jgi:hypothetical protein
MQDWLSVIKDKLHPSRTATIVARTYGPTLHIQYGRSSIHISARVLFIGVIMTALPIAASLIARIRANAMEIHADLYPVDEIGSGHWKSRGTGYVGVVRILASAASIIARTAVLEKGKAASSGVGTLDSARHYRAN